MDKFCIDCNKNVNINLFYLLQNGKPSGRRCKYHVLQRANKYYIENKSKVKRVTKIYRDNNKDKRRKYLDNRKKNDHAFKILLNLRTRLYYSLKRNQKSGHTLDLLGCSIEEFKNHLQNKFDDKMNWENYGTYWHIDHIKPCAKFDLSKSEEQKKCFHFSNMQPMEAYENMSKQDRFVSIV